MENLNVTEQKILKAIAEAAIKYTGGDFTYFTVNGVNSKHAPGKPGTSSSPAEDKPVEMKIEDITPKSIMSVDALHDKILDLEKKVTALEEAMENADNDAEVPF